MREEFRLANETRLDGFVASRPRERDFAAMFASFEDEWAASTYAYPSRERVSFDLSEEALTALEILRSELPAGFGLSDRSELARAALVHLLGEWKARSESDLNAKH